MYFSFMQIVIIQGARLLEGSAHKRAVTRLP
jgi:hypothetical protein